MTLHPEVEIVPLGVPHWANSMEGVGESMSSDATNMPVTLLTPLGKNIFVEKCIPSQS